MTFCSSSKVAVFSLLTIDVDLCLNMSEDLNQIYGRRSLDSNAKKGNIERECKNLPVQGLCADMLKITMANLFLILEPRGVRLINSVHDELVFECKADEAKEIGQIIKAEMESAGSLFLKDLPCLVEVTIADF